MYDSSDLRKGLKIEYEGDPYIVVNFDFVKPGKGQALYKCRLKNMLTGAQFDRNFRSVLAHSDRAVVLEKGRIVLDDTAAAMVANVGELTARLGV